MTPAAPKKKQGLTDITRLPPDLESQLRNSRDRRERKIADSAFGLLVAIAGLAIIGATMYLALKEVDKWVLAGSGSVGLVVLVFGALIADRETVWPVARGMVGLAVSILRARRGKEE